MQVYATCQKINAEYLQDKERNISL